MKKNDCMLPLPQTHKISWAGSLKSKLLQTSTGLTIKTLCFVTLALLGFPRSAFAQEKAKMADQAVDIVGVNTHLYYDGIYTDRYEDIIKPRLVELGIRHLRDGNPTDKPLFDTRVKELAGLGMKFLLICDTRFGVASSLTASKDHIKALNTDVNKPVIMVEGPNEFDCPNQSGFMSELTNTTKSLWNLFKGDGATSGIPVAGPSFCNTKDSPGKLAGAFSDATNYMQYGNMHCYSGGQHVEGPVGGGWGISFDDANSRYQLLSKTDPMIITESGFRNSTDQDGHISVTQRAAAKYLPRSMLYYLNKGITRNYLYQFINNAEDFGILNDDGTPRQQFTALKNYITLLKDPGSSFTTGSLNYTLSGDQTNIHHTLLQKRDGRFYLILWQGVNSANVGQVNVEPAARNLTLNLVTGISNAKVYLPTFNGTAAQSTFTNPTSINLSIPDHIVVVELTPRTATTAADLVVTDIGWTPASPVAGSAVTFSATIKNQGGTATPAGIIHGVAFNVNGTFVNWSDNSTASLAAGASRTVAATGGPAGSATWTAGVNGNYTIVAHVDDINRMTEAAEDNNTRTETLTVSAPAADTQAPTVPAALSSPSKTATSVNLSWTASTDNVGVTGYEIFVNGVSAGTTTATTYSVTGRSCNTAYSFTVRARDAAANNSALSTALSVTTGACAEIDLVVTDITCSPASPATGNVVAFSAVVSNQGGTATAAGVIIGVAFSVNGTVVSWSDNSTVSLAPGASRSVTSNGGPGGTTGNWTAGANGNYTIVAHVDDINRTTEVVETNNTRTETLTIGTAAARAAVAEEQQIAEGAIELYPMPVTQNELRINFEADQGGQLLVELTSAQGQGLRAVSRSVVKGMNRLTVDVGGVKNGTYLLLLRSGNRTAVKKVVIAR